MFGLLYYQMAIVRSTPPRAGISHRVQRRCTTGLIDDSSTCVSDSPQSKCRAITERALFFFFGILKGLRHAVGDFDDFCFGGPCISEVGFCVIIYCLWAQWEVCLDTTKHPSSISYMRHPYTEPAHVHAGYQGQQQPMTPLLPRYSDVQVEPRTARSDG